MANNLPEREIPGRPPTPTWVKAIAIIGALVVLALIVSLVAGVNHGQGLHGG